MIRTLQLKLAGMVNSDNNTIAQYVAGMVNSYKNTTAQISRNGQQLQEVTAYLGATLTKDGCSTVEIRGWAEK